jgi:hypothetical protein
VVKKRGESRAVPFFCSYFLSTVAVAGACGDAVIRNKDVLW